MKLHIPDYIVIVEDVENKAGGDLIVHDKCPGQNLAGIQALGRVLDGLELPLCAGDESRSSQNSWRDPLRFHFMGTIYQPKLPPYYHNSYHYYLEWRTSWPDNSEWVVCQWDGGKSFSSLVDRFVCYKV